MDVFNDLKMRQRFVEECRKSLMGPMAETVNFGEIIYGDFALRKVWAWCQKTLQEGVHPVTHGICPECQSKEGGNTPKDLFPMKRETGFKD